MLGFQEPFIFIGWAVTSWYLVKFYAKYISGLTILEMQKCWKESAFREADGSLSINPTSYDSANVVLRQNRMNRVRNELAKKQEFRLLWGILVIPFLNYVLFLILEIGGGFYES